MDHSHHHHKQGQPNHEKHHGPEHSTASGHDNSPGLKGRGSLEARFKALWR